MKTRPFALELLGALPSTFDSHLERTLSSLAGNFANQAAYLNQIREADVLVYEVYAVERPETAGELTLGLSIVHPGRVGDEYFMTKGHFHKLRESAEVYHCLRGRGVLLMGTEEGDWAVEELRPGRLVYVAPCWAHRSVNVSEGEDLVTLFVYPSHAGHDYAAIESRGFRKLILQGANGYKVADNPLWFGASD